VGINSGCGEGSLSKGYWRLVVLSAIRCALSAILTDLSAIRCVLSAILAGLSAIRCVLSAILLIYQRFVVLYQRFTPLLLAILMVFY